MKIICVIGAQFHADFIPEKLATPAVEQRLLSYNSSAEVTLLFLNAPS
jgi:hypothetical protein